MRYDVALIFLYDAHKRILFQHRAKDAKTLANYWAFFGGHIEKGETPLQAVKRETREELGIKLKHPKFMFLIEFKDKDHYGKKYIFMEKYDPKKKLVLGEGQAMQWYTIPEALKLKMIGHDRKVLKKIEGRY
ncbi:MAG: NUDIX domain-containing protein [Nanoarchaeota archaeon]